MFIVDNCQTLHSLINITQQTSCHWSGELTTSTLTIQDRASSLQALSRIRQALTQLACSKPGELSHYEHLDSKLGHYTHSSTRHLPLDTRHLMLAT
eukprot:1829940-Rhodomonas_salina.1